MTRRVTAIGSARASPPAPHPPEPFGVFAAGSLKAAMTEPSLAFARDGRTRPELVFGVSGLARDRLLDGQRAMKLSARDITQEPPSTSSAAGRLRMSRPTSALGSRGGERWHRGRRCWSWTRRRRSSISASVLVLAEITQLRAAGLDILMSTHEPDQALELADRVALLHDGHLFADATAASAVTPSRALPRRSP